MIPSEARARLLRQHDDLRERMASCLAAAARQQPGQPVPAELREALVALAEAFAAHNQAEEEVLEPLLAEVPGLGARRIARMREEHVAEHRHFLALFAAAAAELGSRLVELAENLDAHMAAEERTFLSPAVLPDQGPSL
jgi:iron-sulfur cluster repair protein YtfE (RIC family)